MDLRLHPGRVAPAEDHEKCRPRRPTHSGSSCNNATRGRRRWKQEAGYPHQARVEHACFRYQSMIGDRLRARSRGGRVAESMIACHVLNQRPELGRPESYSLGRCLAAGVRSLTVSFESCTSDLGCRQGVSLYPSLPSLRAPVTLFEFFAATARARVVSTNIPAGQTFMPWLILKRQKINPLSRR